MGGAWRGDRGCPQGVRAGVGGARLCSATRVQAGAGRAGGLCACEGRGRTCVPMG